MVVVPLWRMGWLPVDGAISLNLHRLIMKLRKWQQQAISACVPKFVEGRQIFVIEACTGSGKSLCSAKAALEMMRRDAVDLVVVLTPNCGTRLGWKKTFERLDVDGRRVNVTDSTSFPRDTDVWVSTYAGYSKIEEALHDRPTVGIFAIIDEFHHPEDSADWGRAVDRLVALSDHAIFLSGTPWKREGKIAVLCGATNVENRPYYREDGRVEADFVYDYKDDLRQDPKTGTRGTVPVKFKFWESTWKSSDGQVVECLPKDLPAFPSDRFQNADEWYEWAKKCDMPLGKHLHFDADLESPLADDVGNKLLRNIVNESLSLLALSRKQIEIACGRKNQSVLLCVAKSMKEARKIAECIQEERPSLRVSIVLSDDNNGAKKLARIARQCRENAADKPDVIVSVGMISEGVDIPQIKVVAYMSAILTVLYFVQVIGRAIRRIPIDSKDQPYADRNHFDTIAYVVAPAHPKLRYIARNIERDVQDACGDAPSGHDDLSNDAQSDDKKKRTGVVTSGDESVGMFRGSDDFSGWHDVVEAIKSMSFTVFSARSIANDLENAVGEEAFYFYMREIIDGKLCESYKDAVNGEECRFDGLLQFMQHKDGLGIKDLPLFEKCLGAVASSSHKMARNARWLMVELQQQEPLAQHGETEGKSRDSETGLFKAAQKSEPLATYGGSRDDVVMSGSRKLGNSQSYLLRRLARDAPDVLERVKTGEIKSARAAAIEAGIITPSPSLQLKDPSPTAQKLLAKKGKEWCLELLEELSSLVLDLPA
jgi:superfamily II DNA or RNA helicase